MKRLKLSNYEQKQQQRLDLSTVKTTPQQQETKAFYPTDKEFTDPLKYIQQIKNQAEMDGICKIVPPSGWKPGFALDTTAFQFETRLQHLNMMSAASRLTNNYCEQLAKYHCSMGNDIQKIPQLEGGPINFYALHTVIKRKGGFEALEDWDPVCEYLELAPNKRNASRLKQVYEKYILPFENFQNTFVSVLGKRKSNDCHQCHKTVTNGIHCADCEQIYHIQCTRYGQMLEEWYCDDCILKTPDEYEFEDGPVYGLKDFQAECEKFKNRFFRKSQVSEQECEEAFWDLLDSPFEDVQVEYGADLHTSEHGSGFPDKKKTPDAPYADHPWNLNNIARLPGSLLSQINKEIPGMTVPWIYIGSCFSTFCWHAEDHFTYSINYHHFGETKTWYGIPAADAEKFDRLMQKECPELFKKSPDLLFHITTMLDPALLRENGIRVVKIHQRPREFVVTFPRAYHAGFNQGFNCAEAVNFALPDWLPFGSLCCSLYTQHKKLPVFCHEELIMSLCQAPKISHCSWLYDQISDLIARETKQRESLMVKFPDLQPVYTQSESVQCSYCHCYCYISWLEDDDVYCLSCLDQCIEPKLCIQFLIDDLIEKRTLLQDTIDQTDFNRVARVYMAEPQPLQVLLEHKDRPHQNAKFDAFVRKCVQWKQQASHLLDSPETVSIEQLEEHLQELPLFKDAAVDEFKKKANLCRVLKESYEQGDPEEKKQALQEAERVRVALVKQLVSVKSNRDEKSENLVPGVQANRVSHTVKKSAFRRKSTRDLGKQEREDLIQTQEAVHMLISESDLTLESFLEVESSLSLSIESAQSVVRKVSSLPSDKVDLQSDSVQSPASDPQHLPKPTSPVQMPAIQTKAQKKIKLPPVRTFNLPSEHIQITDPLPTHITTDPFLNHRVTQVTLPNMSNLWLDQVERIMQPSSICEFYQLESLIQEKHHPLHPFYAHADRLFEWHSLCCSILSITPSHLHRSLDAILERIQHALQSKSCFCGREDNGYMIKCLQCHFLCHTDCMNTYRVVCPICTRERLIGPDFTLLKKSLVLVEHSPFLTPEIYTLKHIVSLVDNWMIRVMRSSQYERFSLDRMAYGFGLSFS